MAANFRVIFHQKKNNIHLKLVGDFDGSSAYELINMLKKYDNTSKIFVHTAYLNSIHPFGVNVFQNNFKKSSDNIVFTGENSCKIAP